MHTALGRIHNPLRCSRMICHLGTAYRTAKLSRNNYLRSFAKSKPCRVVSSRSCQLRSLSSSSGVSNDSKQQTSELKNDDARHGKLQPTISDSLMEKKYGKLACHPDLNLAQLARLRYVKDDHLMKDPSKRLRIAIADILPPSRASSIAARLHLGDQQVYCSFSSHPHNLLEDGTDTRFLPGDPSIWKWRLWAGGSAVYDVDCPLPLDNVSLIRQTETVSDIQVSGDDTPHKVFVTVKRVFHVMESDPEEKFDELKSPDAAYTHKQIMREEYRLCFLRAPPGDPIRKSGIIPPKDPLFSSCMTIDSNALFRFSALTYNAHKIHLNAQYAQEDYGLRNSVVHGPFTQVLLVEFVRRAIEANRTFSDRWRFVFVKSVKYSNLRPLYVDEKITMCCKPWVPETGQDPWSASRWRVWFQTGEGDTASLAVKAEITIETFNTTPDVPRIRKSISKDDGTLV